MDIGSTPVAILAGGFATRLHPVTRTIPESMVKVAGKPFLEHQLEYLRQQGLKRIVLCVGHLGEMIEKHFGPGDRFGLRLIYSYDGPSPLGAAGAIRRALPHLGHTFFALNGDSWLPAPYAPVLAAFEASRKSALMTIYKNENNWDKSNVQFEDGRIITYNRTYDQQQRDEAIRHIDYGLSVFNARVFDRSPAIHPWHLDDLFSDLLSEGDLAGFEIHDRFYKIDSHAALAELDAILSQRSAASRASRSTAQQR